MNATLHQFFPIPGQGSMSSFCVKAQRTLNACGIPFGVQNQQGGRVLQTLNPGVGKLPVLEVDGRHIADSTAIADWALANGDGAKLVPDDPLLADEARWLEDWSDESLYWFGVYLRWKAGFPAFRDAALVTIPAILHGPVGWVLRRPMMAQLHGQGIGRLPLAQVLSLLEGHYDRLARRIDAHDGFLVGGQLTMADIAVFAMLQAQHAEICPLSRERVQARPTLVDWARRVDAATAGEHTAAWA
ncbi:MAG: glutathione S-transferase family protein [Myxococcota bacterium]